MACTINIFSQSFSYSKLRGIQSVIQICFFFKYNSKQCDQRAWSLWQKRMKNYSKIGRKKYQKGGNQKQSLDCKKICCNNPWLSDKWERERTELGSGVEERWNHSDFRGGRGGIYRIGRNRWCWLRVHISNGYLGILILNWEKIAKK